MNDLTSVSETAAALIRKDLADSRECVIKAQCLLDGLRKASVVVNGTREALKSVSAKLDEVEKLYTGLFQQVTRTYGDEPDTTVPPDDLLRQPV